MSGKELATAALEDKEVWLIKESTVVFPQFGRGVQRPAGSDDVELYFPPMYGRMIEYPVSKTDQSHVISIAEMYKRGLAQTGQVFDSDFDFPDGRDTGLQSDPLLAWKDPAELSEMEFQKVNEVSVTVSAARLKEAQRRKDEKEKAKEKTKGEAPGTQEDVVEV